MRSLITSASSWSCVTKMNVMPSVRCSVLSSTCTSLRSFRSSAARGSSSSRTLGSSTRARARATRCRWPPLNWSGRRASIPARRTSARASATFAVQSRFGSPLVAQSERHILGHRQMGEQRILLKHHIRRPLIRRHPRHVRAINEDRPRGRRLQSGDQPEQSRLAAPARPEQRDEFAVADRQRHVIHRRHLREASGDAADLDAWRCGRCGESGHPGVSRKQRNDSASRALTLAPLNMALRDARKGRKSTESS